MKQSTSGLARVVGLSLLAVVIGVLPAFAAHHEGGHSEKNIVETAVSAGSFNTLVAAVKAAGLVDALSAEGPYTVFAPSDEAFAKLPAGTVEALLEDIPTLTSILLYHVVPGSVMAKDVVKLESADTLFGQSLAIESGEGVRVAGANVVATDVQASNGVIHVIDRVMMPKNIVEVAVEAGAFNTLVTAAKAADLVSVLSGSDAFTVFAPTDEAFGMVDENTLASLLEPANKDQLQSVLTYHVVPGRIMAEDLAKMDTIKTVQGQKLKIKAKRGSVRIDGANVVSADIPALNGVIHVIDAVVLP